ncbi:hypothetical protein ABZ345_10455 [Lentzea sp. NPDC005914]|uniref:hypothetical protein n=1 Tax=Lentzea sp. NPDC005914 TaxID=3154572 RepID=UPI0033E3B8FD
MPEHSPAPGSAADRSYGIATTKALFALSLGSCYWPGCPERVVRKVGERAIVNADIAHIRAAKKNGPRWDGDMTPAERKSFSNLLLLCSIHHKEIDRPPSCDNYSAEKLEE